MNLQERLISNAMRMTWFMIIVSSIVILSGVVFCYLGLTGNQSTLEFLGLKLNTEAIGLMVIAFGVLIFYSQRKFFSHLVAPENIAKLFSSINETAAVLSPPKTRVVDEPPHSRKEGEKSIQKEPMKQPIHSEADLNRRFVTVLTTIAVSLVVLGIGIYLILSGTHEMEKVGVAIVAVTVGYWFR